MPAVITDQFRISNAQAFIKTALVDKYYMFFSRTVNFPSTPTNPNNNLNEYFYSVWPEILSGKLIEASKMQNCMFRNDWISGASYDVYDTSYTNQKDQKSVVITDDYNVYVLLEKPNAAVSTIKPTNTLPNYTEYNTDLHRWKFLFKLESSQAQDFLTSTHVPVKNLTSAPDSSSTDILQWRVQQFSVPGEVPAVNITSGGSGYLIAPTINASGDGVGFSCTAVLTGDSVSRIIVNNPGSGYTYLNLTVVSNSGVGCVLKPVIGPVKGFGADMQQTCIASAVCVSTDFNTDFNTPESALNSNDFSQVGMLKNPLASSNSSPYTQSTFLQTYILHMSSYNGSLQIDQPIQQTSTGAFGYVAGFNLDLNLIYLTSVKIPFQTGSISSTSPTFSASIDTVTQPNLISKSGDVLYINNTESTQVSSDQVESVRLILEF